MAAEERLTVSRGSTVLVVAFVLISDRERRALPSRIVVDTGAVDYVPLFLHGIMPVTGMRLSWYS